MLAGMEGMKFKQGCTRLCEGDKLFHYTDGVAKATNAHNALCGRDSLVLILNRSKDQISQDILSSAKRRH